MAGGDNHVTVDNVSISSTHNSAYQFGTATVKNRLVEHQYGDGDIFSWANRAHNKNLSTEQNLYKLYSEVRTNFKKDEFESTTTYNNRVKEYSSSLIGYHLTAELHSSYNADTGQLTIRGLPWIIHGPHDFEETQIPFYTGQTRLTIKNHAILYTSAGSYNYRTIFIEANKARVIYEGFRADYQLTFPSDIVGESKHSCVSAYFTNCWNYLYCNVKNFRVYNIIDGLEY